MGKSYDYPVSERMYLLAAPPEPLSSLNVHPDDIYLITDRPLNVLGVSSRATNEVWANLKLTSFSPPSVMINLSIRGSTLNGHDLISGLNLGSQGSFVMIFIDDKTFRVYAGSKGGGSERAELERRLKIQDEFDVPLAISSWHPSRKSLHRDLAECKKVMARRIEYIRSGLEEGDSPLNYPYMPGVQIHTHPTEHLFGSIVGDSMPGVHPLFVDPSEFRRKTNESTKGHIFNSEHMKVSEDSMLSFHPDYDEAPDELKVLKSNRGPMPFDEILLGPPQPCVSPPPEAQDEEEQVLSDAYLLSRLVDGWRSDWKVSGGHGSLETPFGLIEVELLESNRFIGTAEWYEWSLEYDKDATTIAAKMKELYLEFLTSKRDEYDKEIEKL